MGKQFTPRQWKKVRNQIIYVVATEDYVVLDFQLWRHSSICVNKVRQPHTNIRIVHILVRILNKYNKIPLDLRSSHIRLNERKLRKLSN